MVGNVVGWTDIFGVFCTQGECVVRLLCLLSAGFYYSNICQNECDRWDVLLKEKMTVFMLQLHCITLQCAQQLQNDIFLCYALMNSGMLGHTTFLTSGQQTTTAIAKGYLCVRALCECNIQTTKDFKQETKAHSGMSEQRTCALITEVLKC